MRFSNEKWGFPHGTNAFLRKEMRCSIEKCVMEEPCRVVRLQRKARQVPLQDAVNAAEFTLLLQVRRIW